jgi:uncharacterized protein YgbK (DUF1537 family)
MAGSASTVGFVEIGTPARDKVVVLDDDPTGTQSATGVRVLLTWDVPLLEQALREADSVYVQTNSRAVDEATAIRIVSSIRDDAREAARRLAVGVRFVLRGDSTLRGHVFAETEQFTDQRAAIVFVPAFPDGGRTTRDGVHLVRQGGVDVPAGETEYADDPVFPFASSRLVDYVAEKSARTAIAVDLSTVRSPDALLVAFLAAPPGSVLVPDVVDNEDIRRIAAGIETALGQGASLVVRCAAPLAAELAHVPSSGTLDRPLVAHPPRTLLVCGSHTAGATAQLAAVMGEGAGMVVLRTDDAFADPDAAGTHAARQAEGLIADGGLAVVASERVRSSAHGTLDHGRLVMAALTKTVRQLLPAVDVVVSKGGITSADTARHGLGATSALVLGQVLPGVSVWRLTASDGRDRLLVVVPGNVGDEHTLVEVLSALGVPGY